MLKFNEILAIFMFFYLFQLFFSIIIEKLNNDHLKRFGGRMSKLFEGFVDRDNLEKINAYTQEKSRLSIIHSAASELFLLILVLMGFLSYLDGYFEGWKIHVVWSGLLFFGVLGILSYFIELPFDCYRTFVIEKKYGFNRSTYKLWIIDHIKAGLLSALLLSFILVPILWAIQALPRTWWIWGVVIVSGFQIVLILLYPSLIAPIFNKFESLKDNDLKVKVENLLQGAGLRLKEIFQMDAGRRSSHTNAYFTGIGKSKRVVLFDTLLKRHPQEEILGILAHEVGHFKKRHLIKQLMIYEISTIAIFYLLYCLMSWTRLYSTFGFDAPKAHSGLLIVGIFLQKAGFFLKPFFMALSRRWEQEADQYAVHLLNESNPLFNALKRMTADNLANLAPHPIYVWFNYSHPPLAKRLTLLRKIGQHT